MENTSPQKHFRENPPTSFSCKTLWASLKSDNDTADRHENCQKYFTKALDCFKMLYN